MLTLIQNSYGPWLIWGCFGLVLLAAFGSTVFQKIRALNAKHHIIEWHDDSASVFEEDCEDDFDDDM